jgi:predicted NBD/HSP70 family sugar kinase
MLTARLGLDIPVAVGNDANLGALAECRRGVAVSRADIIYLAGEIGVGTGVISRGRALTGAGGYAGEAGHMVVNPRGRRCRCGARGCWETEIGEEALLTAAGRPGGGGHAAVLDVLCAAANGHRAEARAVRSVGGWLGLGVGNLVNLFDPEMVIFGGVLRHVFPAVEPIVRRHLAAVALAAPREHLDLVVPGLGEDSVLLGAAELAFTPLLDDPLATLAARPSS